MSVVCKPKNFGEAPYQSQADRVSIFNMPGPHILLPLVHENVPRKGIRVAPCISFQETQAGQILQTGSFNLETMSCFAAIKKTGGGMGVPAPGPVSSLCRSAGDT